jgi:hypothetical protein
MEISKHHTTHFWGLRVVSMQTWSQAASLKPGQVTVGLAEADADPPASPKT